MLGPHALVDGSVRRRSSSVSIVDYWSLALSHNGYAVTPSIVSDLVVEPMRSRPLAFAITTIGETRHCILIANGIHILHGC